MLDEDDLEAAVAEGIVMPAQIEALRLFVTNRRRTAERADGALVLLLGVGWQPLRRIFLRPFPSALVERLPPAVYPA